MRQFNQFIVQHRPALLALPRSARAIVDKDELDVELQESQYSPHNDLLDRIGRWLSIADLLSLLGRDVRESPARFIYGYTERSLVLFEVSCSIVGYRPDFALSNDVPYPRRINTFSSV